MGNDYWKDEIVPEIVLNRLLWLMQWAWDGQEQRTKLREALLEWLPTNDDGKELLPDLIGRFVEDMISAGKGQLVKRRQDE